MFPTPVNAVPTNVITMATAIDGVTLMVQALGIIAKLKKHSPGNHAVVRKFEKFRATAKCVN